MATARKLFLPDAPGNLPGPVRVWEQPVTIETYEPKPPNRNPMFLESRVYQGSSGKVYPLPIFDGIAEHSYPREWRAVHIENEFLRVMLLPELGGRIHIGLDKTNGYDFFYRQNVIKPALVGLAGPWASGGVEFNWPQHHRPATYMPVAMVIEKHDDGSFTIWCSDHDPFARMKAAHGICLRPGKSVLELKVRLYNRTQLRQTFLWWANAAARVHELYQSFFPPDVHFVADHAERAISTYPLCAGSYYGIDYAKRAAEGVSSGDSPSQFVPPPEAYLPNDLRWYANIPVPTSYMAVHSEADFFGGYDHLKQAGFVHIANHHIAPGKKQWTWGNHDFGYAWDRQLTDSDGPYIELMAGAYTDNQPDFSFLEPGETKTFMQCWYPIREIGIAHAANLQAACHVAESTPGRLEIRIHATEKFAGALVTATFDSETGSPGEVNWTVDLDPAHPAQLETALRAGASLNSCTVTLADAQGAEVLRYNASNSRAGLLSPPAPAGEPPSPSDVASIDDLFLIGQHLEQYRHATRDPIAYWLEALRRDPGESRCLEAVALWHLYRGEFTQAETRLQKAIERLTRYNGNPPTGSAFYHLGIVRRYLGRDKEAYDALYKATWNFAFRSPAFYALAEIDSAQLRFTRAMEHLQEARRTNTDDLRARNLEAVLLRKLGRGGEAAQLLEQSARFDPTDAWTQYLLHGAQPQDNQTRLDLAFDYARAGLFAGAAEVCEKADLAANDGTVPILCYVLAFLCERQGQDSGMQAWLHRAGAASPDYCFPSRLEELCVLHWALQRNATDGRAQYYLGNLLYDKRRHAEAIAAWEISSGSVDPLPTTWRNLAIAYYNVQNSTEKSREAFDLAFSLDPADARVFFERDQLWKRIQVAPAQRLREMDRYPDLVSSRDDLALEYISLLNQSGRHQAALDRISSRSFRAWEGGEGLVTEQYVRTHIALGREALLRNDPERAIDHFTAALRNPKNLGEGKHLLANQSNLYFWLGEAYDRRSPHDQAFYWWRKAISSERDFQEMSVLPFSAMSFYRVLAYQRLCMQGEANALLADLTQYIEQLQRSEPKIDYFATSLPNTLLFKDNLAQRQSLFAALLHAQVLFASGETGEGEAVLKRILADEPSHGAAADLLEEADALRRLHLHQTEPAGADRDK